MPENKSNNTLTEITVSSLDLLPVVQAGVIKAGFTHCTPIQALTLPIALEGNDVAGQAQTGTGKTAAFLLVIFQRLLEITPKHSGRQPRALVLAPTRELAIQIHKDAMKLLEHLPLKLAICYGGKAYEQQKQQFNSPVDILIGTPGRLIDFFKSFT